MRSLSLRLLLSFLAVVSTPALMAHDVTLSGTTAFASLDGSANDHDGTTNGVFTVNDGNLTVNGTVNCNDDSSTSACAMAFAVSGNMTVNSGGALYAENRSGSGNGGAITLTVGGNLALNGTAIVSSASKTNGSSNGGAVTANVSGSVTLAAGTTIDAGAPNGQGGTITVAAAGPVTVNGNVFSGPSRTLLATRLTGAALDGGSGNQAGGPITIGSTTFSGPAVAVGATANIVSQGQKNGGGSITLDGCGIEIRGLVAALSREDEPVRVSVRSGKAILVDGRDLGATGTRMGRVRADSLQDGSTDNFVDLFATDSIQVLGPSSVGGTLFAVSVTPGAKAKKDGAGTIRVISTGSGVSASGRAFLAGVDGKGTRGGTVSIAAASDVNLDGATIVAIGDWTKPKKQSAGGHIIARSHGGSVLWRNGTGDVRPVGSGADVPPAEQGTIVLTACNTVDTTGSSFPTNGVPTGVFPQTQTGVCSPSTPSLPIGVPALITCNTPPVANNAAATTNEDTTVTVTLSGSDADGDPLTFSIVSGPSNGSLGPIIPTGPNSATVDYTPNLNYNGSDSFVYRADDGNGGTDDANVSISITAVNDPPSFLVGPTAVALEDSGPQTYTNWATSISAGPADESSQTVTFTVTNDNPSLFSVQPAVSSNGTLTYTPAPNRNGTANLTVTAHDDGGTANGGNDTSAPQSSSINITPVNDEPSFVAGPNQTVNEGAGPQSVPNWATAISPGPNEAGQTVTFTVTNDNNALFSSQPAVSPTGTLTYTPAADANGSATVTVVLSDNGGTANGGDDTSSAQTFTITVNSVNDAPSFTSGGNVTVLEDSGAYSAAWATGISAGPANESGQTVAFNIVSNTNAALFAAGPSIAPNGTLTFTPATNAFGSATITVNLQDNGGTANGGSDTSANVSFTITIDPVNDAPSFTPGGDVTVIEDGGPYSAAWATGISAGPNEGGQTVSFNVSNDNNGLFSVQPSISPTGVLTFTTALNAFGSATVTVSLSDNGGTANGGVDTSAAVTFTITVNGVNDPPTAGADSWEIEGNTEIRVDLGAGLTPAVYDTTPSGKGVLDNDADTAEGDPFTVTSIVGCADTTAPYDCTFGSGAKLSMNANGSFTFTPGPGSTSASFQYVVTDQPAAGSPASATGTVTFTFYDMIWYVNAAAAAGGNGTSIAPFDALAPINGLGDADDPGDYLFIHTGVLNGNIVLEQGERLWGQGIGLIIPRNLNGNGSPTVLVAPGVRPQIIAAASNTVTVSGVSGTEVAGLDLVSAGGNAIDVETAILGPAAGVSIYSNVISSAAMSGINVVGRSINGTAAAIDNTSITSTGNGLNVDGIAGLTAVSYTNGAIVSLGGIGIRTDGQPGSTLKVTGLANVNISGLTAGDGIVMSGTQFDANAATAAFETVNAANITVGAAGDPVGASGITATSLSGDVAFSALTVFGGTSGVSIGGTGLFTGATGLRLTGTGGAIVASAGIGLSVANATIGAANLSFTSISATGGLNGIALNNTGTTGSLIVTGTGSAATGGTLQNALEDGIRLTSTVSPSFSWMRIQNTGASGVRGTGVVNFTFANGAITGSGNAVGESNLTFSDNVSGTESNLSGNVSITNSTFTTAFDHGLRIRNGSGTLTNVTVTGNTFTSPTTTATSKGSAIFIELVGSAANVANLTKATVSGNTINNFPSGAGIKVLGGNANAAGPVATVGASAIDVVSITNNQVAGLSTAVRLGTNAIETSVNGRGSGNFNIASNGTAGSPLRNMTGAGIVMSAFGNAGVTGTIANNVIVANNALGSAGISTGADALFGFTDTPSINATVTGNSVSNTSGNGILAGVRNSFGIGSFKITNNIVGAPTASVRPGIRVDSGTAAGGNASLCLELTGNTTGGSGGSQGIGLRKEGSNAAVNVFGIVGMSATSSPAVEQYVDGLNSSVPAPFGDGDGVVLLSATSGFTNCSLP
jgi:hypothetical protein